jgi:hypothetical protein
VSEGQQHVLHGQASAVLELYRQLSVLIINGKVRESRAPTRLIRQMLLIWTRYAALKPAIPTASRWFALAPAHANWLTLDNSRLSTALATQTGVQPTPTPDPLWVEHKLASRIRELLAVILRGGEWSAGVGLVDASNALAGNLASLFRVDEALILTRATTRELFAAREEGASKPDQAEEVAAFRMATVERGALGLTSAWLGFVRAADAVSIDHLRDSFERAVDSPTGPYAARAPRSLLLVLEEIADGIAFERRTEGRRVTPSWWVRHVGARTLTRVMFQGLTELLAEAEQSVIARAEGPELESEPESRAVLVFAGLELAHKIDWGLGTVRLAVQRLATMRSPAAGDDSWPEEGIDDGIPRGYERRLLHVLATIVLDLPHDAHDETRPDLFGQAYKKLFDGTFRALLAGDHDLARDLFRAVLASAELARARLAADLASHAPRQQFIFGTEPLIDLMEISGYALFMQELVGDGIWPEVRAIWDSILAGNQAPELARQLTGVLAAREQIFALTQGGLERTQRRMTLDRLLGERGVVGPSRYWSPFEQARVTPSSQSPIVTVFAPDGLGHHGDLEDLFVAEYLLPRPEAQGATVAHGVQRIRDSIVRERERVSQAGEAGTSPGGPDEDPA